ncbi:multifunctional CCA tRNA nucleotidyl transferase/2'3'-cyclic phosphodiesterase/2'nucleotidase/phosphatase [Candidatus Endobugula sertula]|uniref:CCA-adding enzyme n=1 Tax=Candidatus Endobugula sertula TaxID=62101 RepID=A0A1D2QRV8_9GAMM|nr:multifunctional CCA tRNA nucleotidyl transferase/2'3'-cyclic phosphodiesterase/2'nucleotidase/phosphatase [Candidatus Endobugula sertula]
MNIYLVGGAVRDQLLGYPYTEKDWVVVGSTPENMLAQGFTPVGKDFPVFLHPKNHEEYALARTERKTAPGYKGFTFHTAADVTLKEDLRRRDLTINAIAQTKEGDIIDPYNGQQDIINKRLRHVSPAFREDPVRVLRVARFAARYHHLGFELAAETYQLMRSMVAAGETQYLVAERVWQEFQKALTEQHPEQFIQVLDQCHAITNIFPEISPQYFATCLSLLTSVSRVCQDSRVRFAILCYRLSGKAIRSLCKRLGIPNEYTELAVMTRQYYDTFRDVDKWNSDKLSDLFKKTDALRKTERFLLFIQTCTYLLSVQNKTTSNQPSKPNIGLIDALAAYQDVDPQDLIAQGYAKGELGKAIQKARMASLNAWLNLHQSSITHD